MALGIVLLQGPKGTRFLMSEVPLQACRVSVSACAVSVEAPSGPRVALRGGIQGSFLEPLGRAWSHFVGIYRQKLTRCLQN